MNPAKNRSVISVVIPFRNPGTFLAQAVDSVLGNSATGVELILVDDASQEKFEFPQARLLQSPGVGPAAARNLGWKAATYPFIAFLDADDLWEQGALQFLLEALTQEPAAGISQGKMRHQVLQTVAKDPLERYGSLPHYGVNLGACLFRREFLEEVGGLDESLRFGEDTDLLIRAWHRNVGKVRIPQNALIYRLHSSNMTLQAPEHQTMLKQLVLRQARRARAGLPSRIEPGLAEYLGGQEPPEAIGEAYELSSQSV